MDIWMKINSLMKVQAFLNGVKFNPFDTMVVKYLKSFTEQLTYFKCFEYSVCSVCVKDSLSVLKRQKLCLVLFLYFVTDISPRVRHNVGTLPDLHPD